MAQIKKLSGGGGTPSSKYFMFNGTKVVEGDDNFKQFEQQALNGNRFAQRMLETLRKDSYDNKMVVNNTDTGVEFENVDMNYKKERTGRQFEKGRGWGFRTREGKDLIRDGVDLRISNAGSDTKKENTLDKITRSNRMFDYNDGVYDEFSANNAKYENDVRNIANYFSHGSAEEAAKHFDVSDLGDVDALWTIYNNAAGQIDFEQFLKDVRSQRRAADWDNPTYRLLKNFGFTGYDSNSPEEIEAANAIKFKELGFDPEKAKGVLSFDDDGNLILTQDFLNSFGSEFGNKKGNYHFNDMFSNMLVNGKDNPYTWLNGWTSIGGKLYKSDDQTVKDFLVNSGYQDKNKQSLYTDANDIMQSLWGNQIKFDSYSPENFHSQWMSDKKGLHYRGISGFDIGKDSLGRNNQLIEYYDDSDARDEYGFVATPRYAILDGNGEFVKDVNLNDLNASGERGFSEVTLNSILDGSNGKHFAGKYENLFQGTSGLSDLRVFTDPKTGETFIQDSDLKGNQRGKAVKLPTELAKMLNDQKFYNYIASDKNAKNRFYKMLRGLTSSGVGDIFIDPDGLVGARTLRIKNDLKKAGYTAEQAEQISNLLEEWSMRTRKKSKEYGLGPSKSERSAAILREAAPTVSFKTGGKIEKHKLGDLVGESKGTKGTTKVNKIQGKQESLKQAWGLGSKDSKEFSDADWMDLGAAVSDLTALGVTLVDPTNIAGAIAGGVGSLATFAADIKRDGFQGRDAWSLGGNLLLDLGTALPVFGDILSGKKAIKGIKKVAPVLSKAIKAGAIVGVSDAVVNTIDAIAKGESFTISDMRRIINGISGATTIKRTGLLSPRGKKVDVVPELTIKGKKEGVADITLSKEEMSDILSKDSNKQMEELTNLLARKTNKSASEVGDMFDLKALLKDKKSLQWKFWKGRKSEKIADLGKIKQKRVPLTESEIQKLAKERNAFQNWFFGTGAQQRRFYKDLQNIGKYRSADLKKGYVEHEVPVRFKRKHVVESPASEGATTIIRTPNGRFETVPNPNRFSASHGSEHWVIPSWNPTTIRHKLPKFNVIGIPMPNIASHNLIPEEVYYPGTEPVYEFKKGGILKANSGRGSLGKEFKWKPSNTIDGIEIGKFLDAKSKNNAGEDDSRAETNAILSSQKSLVNDYSRRLIVPHDNYANKETADYNLQLKLNSGLYTDAKLNNATWLAGQKNILDQNFKWNLQKSDSISDQINQGIQERYKNDLYNNSIIDENKNKVASAIIASIQKKQQRKAIDSSLNNSFAMYLQNKLHNNAYADFYVDSQLRNLKHQMAYASPEELPKLQELYKEMQTDDYKNRTREAMSYRTASAKKGGTLRPMSDQMLLDNHKLVAKAVEKLNDNTMKLILKALS